jgi:transcriptional regulator with XRE-family HTH domain
MKDGLECIYFIYRINTWAIHMTPQLKKWTTRIGRALRARRKSLGLTLENLSLLSGATVPTLSLIERGRRDVKLSTLVALTEALRIDLPDLFVEEAPHSATGDGTDNAPGYDLDEI